MCRESVNFLQANFSNSQLLHCKDGPYNEVAACAWRTFSLRQRLTAFRLMTSAALLSSTYDIKSAYCLDFLTACLPHLQPVKMDYHVTLQRLPDEVPQNFSARVHRLYQRRPAAQQGYDEVFRK